MANMLSIYKRRVSLALKIDTIARLDAKAEADNTSRNDVAEYLLSASLSKIMLSEEAQAKVQAEITPTAKQERVCDMKKVNLRISAGVFEAASDLARKMNVTRSELLRFCLEGLTNPRTRKSQPSLFYTKGLINPHGRKCAS